MNSILISDRALSAPSLHVGIGFGGLARRSSQRAVEFGHSIAIIGAGIAFAEVPQELGLFEKRISLWHEIQVFILPGRRPPQQAAQVALCPGEEILLDLRLAAGLAEEIPTA